MDALTWLSRLIAFDTTSCHSNLELIETLQTWFDQHHMKTRLTYDATKQKANLLATFSAQNGNQSEGGLVLSGHTDVVPVDGQAWHSNPFEAITRDGKIYGRGACDMKGFLAVMLALVPQLKTLKLKQPIHFAFSYDEEVGCHGAKILVEDLIRAGIKPAACIVGEPTEMHPVIAHKGISLFRAEVRGRAAHSSLTPEGCNAIDYAAKLICHIRHVADQLREETLDHDYDVPFSSVSTNTIRGGSATNIIPEWCEFIFEFRHLPQVKPAQILERITQYIDRNLLPDMRREYQAASINIHAIAGVPSFESQQEAEIYQLAKTITQYHQIRKVAYATEAGLFQVAGIPTIICGPGSIEQAHRPNEFVTIEQLKKCEQFLLRAIEQWSQV